MSILSVMGPEAVITCWGNEGLEFCFRDLTTLQKAVGFPPLVETQFSNYVDFNFLTRDRHLFLKRLKDCQSDIESVSLALTQAKCIF